MCKNKCFCFNEVVWLWQWKWGWNWKKRPHRYNIERPRPRHGHKYTKYKMCLGIKMVICIKQHLSNIWSWIHKKLRNTDAGLKKKALLIKKSVYYVYCQLWVCYFPLEIGPEQQFAVSICNYLKQKIHLSTT